MVDYNKYEEFKIKICSTETCTYYIDGKVCENCIYVPKDGSVIYPCISGSNY